MSGQETGRGWIGRRRPDVVVVVPCYDEASRLRPSAFGELFTGEDICAIFVDDGSTDGTLEILHRIQDAHPGRVEVLALPDNGGKSNAVATGMRAALGADATWVGYLDADLAVSIGEWRRVTAERNEAVDGIVASRVRLLGRAIDRKLYRHLVGRVFATYASALLRLPVYDTQCGGKLFRATPVLAAALDEPFTTRWLFDVEILARLLYPVAPLQGIDPSRLVEVPLRSWQDVAGSALAPWSAPQIAQQIVRLTRDVRRRQRACVR
jgi:glycosyltransferase involved in cell wall biosynthesis